MQYRLLQALAEGVLLEVLLDKWYNLHEVLLPEELLQEYSLLELLSGELLHSLLELLHSLQEELLLEVLLSEVLLHSLPEVLLLPEELLLEVLLVPVLLQVYILRELLLLRIHRMLNRHMQGSFSGQ